MTTSTESLILTGEGYGISVAPDAVALRDSLLALAARVSSVADNQESAEASFHMRKLAALRVEIEKTRKRIKEPVLAVGKKIDQCAKDFLASLEAEESRLRKLIADHATEVERERVRREAEERRAAEAARRAREEAEAAVAEAERTNRIADVIAARQAESELSAAREARMDAAEETAQAVVPDGIRFAWDYEVIDAHKLAMKHPELVRIEVRRAEMLAAIKDAANEGASMQPWAWEDIGIRPFQKSVVSTR